MANQKLYAIGRIVKPQGIRGEVKMLSGIDNPEVLAALQTIVVDGVDYPLQTIREQGGAFVLTLKGVTDRNQAELLRDKTVYAKALPKLPDGRYYLEDILGATVQTETGELLGTLTDILQHGSADVYCVQAKNGADFMFPCLKEVVVQMGEPTGVLVVNQQELEKVAVYED